MRRQASTTFILLLSYLARSLWFDAFYNASASPLEQVSRLRRRSGGWRAGGLETAPIRQMADSSVSVGLCRSPDGRRVPHLLPLSTRWRACPRLWPTMPSCRPGEWSVVPRRRNQNTPPTEMGLKRVGCIHCFENAL